ncbi:putative transcription regulator, MarR family 2 [Thermococcus cleftensis]|uniref:HTH-type transcriptional regulator n=1 Tax=Thermococcus cleftensis (strain DSM 27260 / KACC 17922 / CL1) TaxID=163003 RepID=I3ZUB6_THECF|nr:MarR family transcriptional regulator [Thermococcus cleftensis]AFL95300.1 putative transcription regulator, MarR family 2 [Thermococcus cleftensis]
MGVEEAKRIVMNHFAGAARRFGFSELYGYIYGALFLAREPMSLAEIAERTGYSLSHVSSALKAMESLGFVVRVKKPGDKRAYYRATRLLKDWRQAAYYNRVLEDVEQMKTNLMKALAELEGEEGEEVEFIRESIEFALKRNELAERIIRYLLSHDDEEVLERLVECLESEKR